MCERLANVRKVEVEARRQGLFNAADLMRQLGDAIEAGGSELECCFPVRGGGSAGYAPGYDGVRESAA